MADIRHRVGIKAPLDEVFGQIATLEGLRRWWTTTVEGEAGAGGELRFFFGGEEPAASMEVSAFEEGALVEWRCVQGPDDWVGSTQRFELSEQDGQIVVLFSHAGWPEANEFFAHCSMRWASFLLSMKSGCEGWGFKPWPYDLKTDNWG